MNEPFTFDLFLSYAAADRAWVQGYLIPALGVPRERLVTHDDFRLGAPRVSEIERAVTNSHYSILILSPAYLADEWANFGEQLAAHLTTAEQSVRLIPLLKSECELPLRIDFRVRLDCTKRANWKHEIARLRDLLNQPEPPPEHTIECPYPGMIPFKIDDSHPFYGRTKEIDELVRRIRVQNFLFVIGPSGSGKSSLVFAGLVAELNKRQPDTWLVKTIRPGSDPLTALNDSTIALSNHITNQLLIIDQFEELFTQSDKPTQTALIARLKALRAENLCTIVITMRADFYPDLMNSDLWPLDPSERVEIAPLRGAALAEAIGKPAEQVGVYLEAGLVERLLADAADEPGVLPLVQETMVLLWDKRERRLLPLRAYEELGQGNLSGLAVAIATRADAVFAQLAESERKIARRIFLRLVQFGEGRADTRRQQRVSALRASGDDPNEFERTLTHLTDHRLLTLTGEEKDADRQVDIAHEALIAGWQRFRQWVNERREAEQTRRRLEDKAREWERLGACTFGLLDPIELHEADNWLESDDAQDLGYSETLIDLVEDSRSEIEQAEREKEEARQRELAQAKALANLEHKSSVRQRRTIIVLFMLTLMLMMTQGALFLKSSQLSDQVRISDSRRLAAQSASNRETNFDLALLLGAEALRLDNNLEVRSNLLDSLVSKPQLVQSLHGHKSVVYRVTFSPDGKTLASGSNDKTIILWDVNTRQIIGQPLTGHTNAVTSVAFSPDGKTLASGSWDTTIILWDVSTQQPIGTPLTGHTNAVTSVAFSPDGKTLASGSKDKTIILWNVNSRQPIGQPLTGHKSGVNSVVFSPDGKAIASGSEDITVILWDVNTRQPIGEPLSGHKGNLFGNGVNSVAFSPDGKTLASSSDDNMIILWDVSTSQPIISQPLTGHKGGVNNIAFSPDGKTLASGSNDKTIILWDVKSRQPIGQPLTGQKGSVTSVAFSLDGKTLASASDDSPILWDVSTRQPIQPMGQALTGHKSAVISVTFSPDGKTLTSESDDGTIILWDMVLRRPIDQQPRTGHKIVGSGVVLSPDGKMLASASWDNSIILFDWSTSHPIGLPLTGHKSVVWSMTFSPDGKTLASGSGDTTIILWDVSTHQPIGAPLTGHKATVYSIAFSPDGKTLASGSADNTIILWDMDLESWKKRACDIANRNLTLDEWKQYINPDPSSYRATCPGLPLEPVATPTPKP